MLDITQLDALRVNPEWRSLPLFDRTGWTRLPFGGFADNINVRVDPADAADEIYVGLEHVDSGDCQIRRWGKGSDVIGTKLRFRKGDVIFGRRRAYQRKLAVAEFDGICSAHAMVIRARPDAVLPEFLPFLMMSDRFMKRAVEISVGSLSPTVNWTTLKGEEFELPPIRRQVEIARLLTEAGAVLVSARDALERWSVLKNRAIDEWCAAAAYHAVELERVATFQYGLSLPLENQGMHPVLRMMNFDEELVVASDLKFINAKADVLEQFALKRGDVLFNRTNSLDLVGKTGIFDLSGTYLFASYLVRVTTNREALLPEFLNFYLNSSRGQSAVRAFATPGVSQSNISAGSLKRLKISLPPIAVQDATVKKLCEISDTKRSARSHVDNLEQLQQRLVDAVFG